MRSTMSLNMKRSDDIASTSRMMIANDSSDYRDVAPAHITYTHTKHVSYHTHTLNPSSYALVIAT